MKKWPTMQKSGTQKYMTRIFAKNVIELSTMFNLSVPKVTFCLIFVLSSARGGKVPQNSGQNQTIGLALW